MSSARTKLRIAIGGALAGAVGLVQAASGQGDAEPAGLRATLDYSLGVDVDSNHDLDDPSPGTYAAVVNGFDFALLSNTRTESFALSFGTELRIQDDPGDRDDSRIEWTDPRFALLYTREAANARLSLSADLRIIDVDDSEPFFIDADGDTIVDERTFTEGGTLTDAGARVTLETGINAPIGTTYTLSFRSRTYNDTDDPDVYDRLSYSLSTSTRLRFSSVTTGYLDLSAGRYEYTGGRETVGRDLSANFGLVMEMSPTLTGQVFLGYGKTHEEEEIDGETIETIDQGPIGSASLTRTLSNGTIFGSYERQMVEDTFRNSLTFGRTITMAAYELSADLGVTNLDGGDLQPTYRLSLARPLPDGQLTASIRRSVTVNTDDEERVLTAGTLAYAHEINSVSSFRLGLDFALIEGIDDDGDDDDQQRATLTASYTHALTQDWGLSVGYRGRARSTETEDAVSNAVFVNIGRRFTLR